MANHSFLKFLTKYNERFQQLNIPMQIVSWDGYPVVPVSTIILTTGITLSGTEVRKFCIRSKSPYLQNSLLQIYSSKSITDRDTQVKSITTQYRQQIAMQVERDRTDAQRELRKINMLKARAQRLTIGFEPGSTPWHKGLTKHTNETLMRISIERTGSGNPMYGTHKSEQSKQEKSIWLKERIESGQWTPHVHNSRTHFESKFRDKAFRSSWEAIFQSLHPTAEYETIRIPYEFEGNRHTYIVDFVDHVHKQLYEIRPIERTKDPKTHEKLKVANKWATDNGYTFTVLTQQYFIDNIHLVCYDELDIPNIDSKLRYIRHENDKQKRNIETSNGV